MDIGLMNNLIKRFMGQKRGAGPVEITDAELHRDYPLLITPPNRLKERAAATPTEPAILDFTNPAAIAALQTETAVTSRSSKTKLNLS